jgi:hypothetical protein
VEPVVEQVFASILASVDPAIEPPTPESVLQTAPVEDDATVWNRLNYFFTKAHRRLAQ